MTDLRDALSHVLWIGGGPQAGKSTLARLLAGRWDLKIYDLDWHLGREHRVRAGPEGRAFGRLTMDERWSRPPVSTLVSRTVAIWEEVFALVVEDLVALERHRVVVAEGPAAAPWLVAPLLRAPQQAIFLIPTAEVRERVETRRWGPGQVERFPGILDRGTALTKVRQRDGILDERIAASCRQLGLRCETMDGSRDLDENVALIEEHFREFLPATPNV